MTTFSTLYADIDVSQETPEIGKWYWVKEEGGNWFLAQWSVRGWSTHNLFFDIGGYDVIRFVRIPDPPEEEE